MSLERWRINREKERINNKVYYHLLLDDWLRHSTISTFLSQSTKKNIVDTAIDIRKAPSTETLLQKVNGKTQEELKTKYEKTLRWEKAQKMKTINPQIEALNELRIGVGIVLLKEKLSQELGSTKRNAFVDMQIAYAMGGYKHLILHPPITNVVKSL